MTYVDEKLAVIRDRCATVLDVGAGTGGLRARFKSGQYRSTDIREGSGVDVVADAHDLAAVSDASVDAVISFNLLEHLHSPHLAAAAMRRVLKPGGYLLLSTPFIHPYHGGSCPDYYRFSKDGLRHLFRDFSELETVNDGGFFFAAQYFLPQPLLFLRPLFRLADTALTAHRASGHATILWARK